VSGAVAGATAASPSSSSSLQKSPPMSPGACPPDAALRPSAHALLTIEAQRHADDVVRRLIAGDLDAEGLALELGKAYGTGLQALARALTKAVQGTPSKRVGAPPA